MKIPVPPPKALYVLGVAGLCATVFLFFKAFFDQGLSALSTEILAAVLGATLTVGITLLLLERQSVSQAEYDVFRACEEAKFERLLELSRAFIRSYVRAAHDRRFTRDELLELEELALTISLFTEAHEDLGGRNAGEILCRFVLQLEVFGMQDSALDETRFRAAFGDGEPVRAIRFVEVLEALRRTLGVLDAGASALDDHSSAHRLLSYTIESELAPTRRAA